MEIILNSTSPEQRALIEDILAKRKEWLNDADISYVSTEYSLIYWLVRYSGLIQKKIDQNDLEIGISHCLSSYNIDGKENDLLTKDLLNTINDL